MEIVVGTSCLLGLLLLIGYGEQYNENQRNARYERIAALTVKENKTKQEEAELITLKLKEERDRKKLDNEKHVTINNWNHDF